MAYHLSKYLSKFLIENQDFHLVKWQRPDGTTFYHDEDLWLVRQRWGETEIIRFCNLAEIDFASSERVKASLQGYLKHIAMAGSGTVKVRLVVLVPDLLDTMELQSFREAIIQLEQRQVLMAVDFLSQGGQVHLDRGRSLDLGLSAAVLQDLIHTVNLLSPVERQAIERLDLSQIQPVEQEEVGFSKEYPWVTNSLVLVLGVVFLVSAYYAKGFINLSVDGLISLGAKYGPAIVMGEYWRLLTAAFLHGGLIHFCLNIFALYHLGRAVEKIYGHIRFFVIYLIAAIAGNIMSFYFLPDTVSVGASGAIFGLFGALLALKWKSPKFFATSVGSGVVSSIVINIVYGIITPGIDNYAHIGGLLGGLLTALPLALGKDQQRIKLREVVGIVLLSAAMLGAGWLGWRQELQSPVYLAEQGQGLLQAGEFQRATEYLKEATTTEPDNLRYKILLGWALLEDGEQEQALMLFDEVLEKDANNAAAHYFKAHALLRQGLIQQAYAEAQAAVKLAPEYVEAKTLVEQIESHYKKE